MCTLRIGMTSGTIIRTMFRGENALEEANIIKDDIISCIESANQTKASYKYDRTYELDIKSYENGFGNTSEITTIILKNVEYVTIVGR